MKLTPEAYVGDLFEVMGKWQLQMMKNLGLKPQHSLLDVGCGCLRGGIHFIQYLEREKYFGVDKHLWLVTHGRDVLLPKHVLQKKLPHFLVSEGFSFQKFSETFDFALAQSVFTHLSRQSILRALQQWRKVSHKDSRFISTWFIGQKPRPADDDDQAAFHYTRDEIEKMANSMGLEPIFRGAMAHPRHQVVVELVWQKEKRNFWEEWKLGRIM